MVAIFGASVTAQKNGYAKLIQSRLGEPVSIFGYGGMHLSDAGVCMIDPVLQTSPDICIVDWFSTWYTFCSPDTDLFLDTIAHRFGEAGCKLVFLFLPYRNGPDKPEFYRYCQAHLRKRNLAFIDISGEFEPESLPGIIRDNIHTTKRGSARYADLLLERFSAIRNGLEVASLPPTVLSRVRYLEVDSDFSDEVILEGNCRIVGPHSGILSIRDRNGERRVNTWDQWCYFYRDGFTEALEVEGSARVRVLQDAFDTSLCSGAVDFSRHRKRFLLRSIHYLDGDIRVANLDRSRKIAHAPIAVLNFISKTRQRLFRFLRNHTKFRWVA